MGFGKLTNLHHESSSSEIKFEVLNSEVQNYETPFVYNNVSSPITLAYVNENVKTGYQIHNNNTSLTYNGSLLKTANIDLVKLNCGISFQVQITTADEECYQCRIHFMVPLKTEESTIYEGNVLQTISLQGSGKFYQF